MDTLQDSFSNVEYLSIFTAFIYGYVTTRFFSGWASMISFRKSINFSREHLIWTLLTFGLLIDVWWGSWIKGNYIHKNVALFYLSLLSPLILFCISVVLFPPLSDHRFLDLQQYFNRIRKYNYLLFAALFLSFEWGRHYFKPEVTVDLYFNLFGIALTILGYFSRSTIVQNVILLVGCVMLVTHLEFPAMPATVSIENFSLTEYLTIFIAFIYGSIASRFLTGWGIMMSRYDQIMLSREHIAWTLLSFGLLLDFWIGSWPREKFISQNINYFILTLSVPVVFYVQTAVIFPAIKADQSFNLQKFFESHKKMIILLFGVTIAANGITANVIEQQWMDYENLFRIVAIALAILGVATKKVMIERTILILGWIMLIAHTILES